MYLVLGGGVRHVDEESPAVPETPQRLVQHELAEVPPRVGRRLCSDRLEPQFVATVER